MPEQTKRGMRRGYRLIAALLVVVIAVVSAVYISGRKPPSHVTDYSPLIQ